MVFSTNQNRQFYVVGEVTTSTPSALKQTKVGNDADGNMYFEHYGAGGLTRSDLICADNVTYAKASLPTSHKMKQCVVTLDSNVNSGNPISGQDYVLRVVIDNYVGMSDCEPYFKYGAVHGMANMSASDFYKKMAISLAKNFSRELAPMLKFYVVASGTGEGAADVETEVTALTKESDLTGTYKSLKMIEVEQEWRLGVKEQTFVNFQAIPTTVTYQGDELVWGTVVYSENATNVINNGKTIADLEYFCMGERADQYRNLNWPHNLDTQYLVKPTQEYYVLDIHYHYQDSGTYVQKSEKTITFVATTKAIINSLITKINAVKANLVTALA